MCFENYSMKDFNLCAVCFYTEPINQLHLTLQMIDISSMGTCIICSNKIYENMYKPYYSHKVCTMCTKK